MAISTSTTISTTSTTREGRQRPNARYPPTSNSSPVAPWHKLTAPDPRNKELPPRPATPAPKLRHIAEAVAPRPRARVEMITIKALASDVLPVQNKTSTGSKPRCAKVEPEYTLKSDVYKERPGEGVKEMMEGLREQIDQTMGLFGGERDQVRRQGGYWVCDEGEAVGEAEL